MTIAHEEPDSETGAGASQPSLTLPPPATPAIAIASVLVSMALIAVGNGLMFAYIPVRLGAEGFPPTWAGGILTGLSAGCSPVRWCGASAMRAAS